MDLAETALFIYFLLCFFFNWQKSLGKKYSINVNNMKEFCSCSNVRISKIYFFWTNFVVDFWIIVKIVFILAKTLQTVNSKKYINLWIVQLLFLEYKKQKSILKSQKCQISFLALQSNIYFWKARIKWHPSNPFVHQTKLKLDKNIFFVVSIYLSRSCQ